MNRIKILLVVCLLAIFHGWTSESIMACPTCKLGLHGNTALGYAISILFMMAMPFTIFGGWIVAIVRLRRNIAIKR